ncbi:Leukotriene A-4 hydrolase/aminopeptidase [Paramicrosporidium saccamoebae]|uniref:Leukotriene A-4 hydrolase/aminopeptidase n=1 Tax=Paramicrosporidium saccamoebae TaxID=1246581 RepID=A0A2H9TFX2_9FUNG|nr:Leukotriene A-4 hydrolase/aminopeptidase [Paramicrosporidium saccamoebae]
MWLPVLGLLGAVACSVANYSHSLTNVSLDMDIAPSMQWFKGAATLTMKRIRNERVMVLDCGKFHVTKITCLEQDVQFRQFPGRVEVLVEKADPVIVIQVAYKGSFDSNSSIRMVPDHNGLPSFHFIQDGRNLFPCPDVNTSQFTFAASIRVPGSLSVIFSASLDSYENHTFHYKQDNPVTTSQLAMAVGRISHHNIAYGTLYVETVSQTAALAYLSRWKELMDTKEATFRRERGLSVLVMPSSYPQPYAAYENLILVNSELVTEDQSHLPVLIRAIATSITIGLRASVEDRWLKEGLINWIERKMLHHVVDPSLAQHVALRAWEKEFSTNSIYSTTAERAFAMFIRLESLIGLEMFTNFMTTFISRNMFITPGNLRSEMLKVFHNLPCIDKLRRFPWDEWCSPGQMPDIPHYRDTLSAAPLKLAISWLNNKVPIDSQFANLNSVQRSLLFDLLLSDHSRLTPATIYQMDSIYSPSFSPDPVIRSKWFVLLARTRSYKCYEQLHSGLLTLNMAEHCIPVYVELRADTQYEWSASALEKFHEHRKLLHVSVSKVLKRLNPSPKRACL